MLLTNGREWRLYHVSFGKPPQIKLVDSWNLMNDEPAMIADKFNLICQRNIKKGGLAQLWEKSNALTAYNILKVILSEESITSIRRRLKRTTDITVSPEEIIGAVRHMLNESAIAEMAKLDISVSEKKKQKTAILKRRKVRKG